MDLQQLQTLNDQQIRDYFENIGILSAGLLTRQQLLDRYINILNLNKGGAKAISSPKLIPGTIKAYPITDMRW